MRRALFLVLAERLMEIVSVPLTSREITVRPATRSDLPSILEIYNEAVLNTTASADYEPQTLEARRAWFAAHLEDNYPVFVAEDERGRIVGWSSLSRYHARFGYRFTVENSVYVAAEQRGQGIGKRLIPPLIDSARERGWHAMLASISADNEASIRLHAAFGFAPVAQFKEIIYKFDRWLDVIYMELLLDGAKGGA